MASTSEDPRSRDERLDALLVEWMEAAERGAPPDLAPLIAEHPDLADELREFVEDWLRLRAHAAVASQGGGLPRGTDSSGPAPKTPDRIGDYDVVERVAQGGMGVVYKAIQRPLGRTVALKMLLPGAAATSEQIRRFEREAEAVARLEHPGIVPIYEVGRHDGLPFYSMRYVPGPHLSELAARGPLEPREAARLVRDVAEALEYAHRRGVLHRDLKPANVLLDWTESSSDAGRGARPIPQVADFGLAKQLADDASLTLSGQIVGTPSYMAPEQLPGSGSEAGPATDVYALGAVLYCLVTGRPPFQSADPLDTLRLVRDEEVVRPRRLNPSVPRDLETIVLRCLERDPARRFATAAALVAELNRFLEGRPIESRPAGRLERAWRWSRRKPATALLGVALLAVAGIGMAWAVDSHFEARRRATEERQRREELERVYYVSLVRQADLEWQTNNVNRADALLDRCDPASRHWEWRFLKGRSHLERLVCRGHESSVRQVAYSPDGAQFASAGIDRTMRIWDAASGAERMTLRFGAAVMSVDWSVDGRWIAVGLDDGRIVALDAEEGAQRWTKVAHRRGVNCVALSSDSRRLATAGEDGEVKLFELESGADLRTLATDFEAATCVRFDDSGRWLAASGTGKPDREASDVYVWSAETGERTARIATESSTIHRLAFVEDRERILTADDEGTIALWNTADGELERSFDEHGGSVRSLATSSDGRTVASGDKDGVIMIWRLEDGRILRELKGHHLSVLGLAFRPRSDELASCGIDGLVRVWDVDAPDVAARSAGHRDRVNEVATSRDGRAAASASKDRTVRLWDARTGEPTATFREHEAMVLAVAFGADDRWLVSGDESGRVLRWDASDGRILEELATDGPAAWSLAVNSAGDRIAYGRADGRLVVGAPGRGESLWEAEAHAGAVRGVRFRPDGQVLASCGDDGRVRSWDVRTGRPLEDLTAPGGAVWSVAFAADGERLAASGSDGSTRVWRLGRTPVLELVCGGHTGVVYSVVFSPDGKRLVTGGFDHTVKIWELHTGQDLLTLREPGWSVNSVAFTPDGGTIVAGCSDWRVHWWRAPAAE